MPDGRQYNGGARPGAGRPPKPVEDAQRSVLLELFDEQAERAIVENMIANARRRGVLAAPSATAAATWLWDRKYGKVKELREHAGDVTIRVIRHHAELAQPAPGATADQDDGATL